MPVELLTMLMALTFFHQATQILAECGSARVENEHKSLQKTLVLLGLLVPLGMTSDLQKCGFGVTPGKLRGVGVSSIYW